MDDDLPEAIPAATLILMRPATAGGAPEILMLQRAETMAFAAGALVFPGGRIDPADRNAASRLAPDLEDAAARIAAIRETIEETGVAPALRGPIDPQVLRAGLGTGADFGELLDREGVSLELDTLTPFARWCPNFREARRFDTMFYLGEAPKGATAHSADRTESVATFWAAASDVLAEIEAGRAKDRKSVV